MNSNPPNFYNETIDCIVRSRKSADGKGPRLLAMSPSFERELIITASSCWELVACDSDNRMFHGIPYKVIYSSPATWIAAID